MPSRHCGSSLASVPPRHLPLTLAVRSAVHVERGARAAEDTHHCDSAWQDGLKGKDAQRRNPAAAAVSRCEADGRLLTRRTPTMWSMGNGGRQPEVTAGPRLTDRKNLVRTANFIAADLIIVNFLPWFTHSFLVARNVNLCREQPRLSDWHSPRRVRVHWPHIWKVGHAIRTEFKCGVRTATCPATCTQCADVLPQ